MAGFSRLTGLTGRCLRLKVIRSKVRWCFYRMLQRMDYSDCSLKFPSSGVITEESSGCLSRGKWEMRNRKRGVDTTSPNHPGDYMQAERTEVS